MQRGANMQELVSKQLVQYLVDRGVEYVFGLCGHTNIAVLVELENSPITFINTRHEQIAAHMRSHIFRLSVRARFRKMKRSIATARPSAMIRMLG